MITTSMEIPFPIYKFATLSKPKIRILAERLCGVGDVTVEELKGPSRFRKVCVVRQEFMYQARKQGETASGIARFLNRDHTTILHGIKAAEKRRASI